MHLARMEFIGYHVFAEEYKDLTPDQASFIEVGVMKVYSDLFGGNDKDKKEIEKLRRRSRHRR